MSTTTAARPWQVWRKAWWTRPVLLVLYAGLLTLVGLGFLAGGLSEFVDSRGLDGAGRCERVDRAAAEEQDCLLEAEGQLDGPSYSRGPGSDWYFLEPDDTGPEDADDVEVGTVGSRTLEDAGDQPVVGLFWHGELVAFEVDGELVETTGYGNRSWTWLLLGGLACLGGVLMLGHAAGRKRRRVGWWGTDGERTELSLGAWAMVAGTLLAVPALLSVLPFAFGLPLWVVWSTYAVLLALMVRVVTRRRRAAD